MKYLRGKSGTDRTLGSVTLLTRNIRLVVVTTANPTPTGFGNSTALHTLNGRETLIVFLNYSLILFISQ